MKRFPFFFLVLSFFPFHLAEAQSMKAVDLGLSVQWAICDLGATSPEEDGYRYAWGDIMPKTDKKDDASSNMRISVRKKYHTVDNKTRLDLSDDAAFHDLGENWRIPTKEECDELLANCNYKWTKINGVSGYLFISKKNGKSVFFADDRDHWTSSLYTETGPSGQVYYEAWVFASGNEIWAPDRANTLSYAITASRRMPRSIRPVYDPNAVSSNIRSQASPQQTSTSRETATADAADKTNDSAWLVGTWTVNTPLFGRISLIISGNGQTGRLSFDGENGSYEVKGSEIRCHMDGDPKDGITVFKIHSGHRIYFGEGYYFTKVK